MFYDSSNKQTEEDYYIGLHHASLKFAVNSKSEKGKKMKAAAMPTDESSPTQVYQSTTLNK